MKKKPRELLSIGVGMIKGETWSFDNLATAWRDGSTG